ncbi:MAG: transcription-repair coupling factor [Clostridia bacterium]|nr:transcription-repair coupling factor [Clostridia bacterium]
MLPKVFSLDNMGGDLAALRHSIGQGKNCSVFYAAGASRCHIATGCGKFFLYITPDRISARAAWETLTDFCEKEVALLVEKDDVLIHLQSYVSAALSERMSAITSIYNREVAGAVITAEGLCQYFPDVISFGESTVKIKTGEEISPQELIHKLVLGGYRREELTESVGSFSARGDRVDVWAGNLELPLRIEFFGDTIESLRLFAPDSMLSVRTLEQAVLSPRSDILLSQDKKEAVIKKLSYIRRNAKQKTGEIIDDILHKLELNPSDPSLIWLLPFISDRMATVFDYLPADAVVILDEVKAIDDKIRLANNAHNIRLKSFIEAGEALPEHTKSFLPRERVYDNAKNFTMLGFQQITSSNPVFEPDALYNIKSLPIPKYSINIQSLASDVANMALNEGKVYIYTGTADSAKSIADFLRENGIGSLITETGEGRHDVLIIPRKLSRGFNYPKYHLAVIGTDDIIRKSGARNKSAARKRQAFVMPVKGDYVVHDNHGIGMSEGVVSVETRGGKRDYYVVLYKGGDKLYLPVDQLDSLEKYTGGGTPSLHKLGGKEFERVKERVKASIKKMAIDLVGLYEKRLNLKGHKYQPDTPWQKELEDSFEFTETDDQLIAIAEIKEDMEKGKVMDRLLCGDVGFGKTEVAIRAVFKTVMEGKQAAILAPTTILCQQHFNTVKQRFHDFGIKIDVLSRFVSQDYIKEALKRIASGETNVVVATHRLLSKDVVFQDLGLLVLDEEQRFGVEHKEKIKVLKNNINVLSLSATPIPRTLHMALSGIRDISTLETPPNNRLPVETYVVEYSDTLVQDAIRRELARNGQVFILFNHVVGIEKFYSHIVDILDDNAEVIYAHGQMPSHELEEKIRAFYNKDANVLISTTIIENGIDLPDANTLIVIDSDMLGLAELYQLKGRVGRSFNLAYAYFTVRESKVLTENAVKRLDAIAGLTELGSGFKVAMQDLEIRGAGNIMGREQHGNMEKVGYDMYTRLLNETVGELRGGVRKPRKEIEIVADGDVSLPQEYITDSEQRVKFYKSVSLLSSAEDKRELLDELTDVYGKPPESVTLLAAVGLIKNLAQTIEVKRLVATDEGLALHFHDNGMYKNEGVFGALSTYADTAVLSPTQPPVIIFNNKNKTPAKRLELLEKFLLAATAEKSSISVPL